MIIVPSWVAKVYNMLFSIPRWFALAILLLHLIVWKKKQMKKISTMYMSGFSFEFMELKLE